MGEKSFTAARFIATIAFICFLGMQVLPLVVPYDMNVNDDSAPCPIHALQELAEKEGAALHAKHMHGAKTADTHNMHNMASMAEMPADHMPPKPKAAKYYCPFCSSRNVAFILPAPVQIPAPRGAALKNKPSASQSVFAKIAPLHLYEARGPPTFS